MSLQQTDILGDNVNPECGTLAAVTLGLPEFQKTWQLALCKP